MMTKDHIENPNIKDDASIYTVWQELVSYLYIVGRMGYTIWNTLLMYSICIIKVMHQGEAKESHLISPYQVSKLLTLAKHM